MIIKVCGMRETENIRAIESLGIVDLMGFVFYERSPRYVGKRPDYLPEQCRRVGVFVNERIGTVLSRVREFGLHAVQLHGRETPEECLSLRNEGLTVIKAFSIDNKDDLRSTLQYEGKCDYYLFDTACTNYGGSGRRFDWSLLRHYRGQTPFLLSGGIRPESLPVVQAFHHSLLAGIDLNSGFETSPGIKDADQLNEFISNIKKEAL